MRPDFFRLVVKENGDRRRQGGTKVELEREVDGGDQQTGFGTGLSGRRWVDQTRARFEICSGSEFGENEFGVSDFGNFSSVVQLWRRKVNGFSRLLEDIATVLGEVTSSAAAAAS